MEFKLVELRANRITGWYFDSNRPEEPQAIDVIVDGQNTTRLECTNFRNELNRAEFTNRHIGFRGTIPPEYWDGQEHLVEVSDARSGEVLATKKMLVPEARTKHNGVYARIDLVGPDFVYGWATSSLDEPVSVRLLHDGDEISRSWCDLDSVKTDGKSVLFPNGTGFFLTVPRDVPQGSAYRLAVVSSSGDVLLELPVRHARPANEVKGATAHDVIRGRRFLPGGWTKRPVLTKDTSVESLEVNSRFIRIVLSGESQNKKVHLRLGERRVVCNLGITDLEAGRREYVKLLKSADELDPRRTWSLHDPDKDESPLDTFDLRLGDSAGRRPDDLPESVRVSETGELHSGLVDMSACELTGWALDTRLGTEPVQVTLRKLVNNDWIDVAEATTGYVSKAAMRIFGPTKAGFRLRIPETLLDGQEYSLALVARGTGERTIWKDSSFKASDGFLTQQLVSSLSSRQITNLLDRIQTVGRTSLVESLVEKYPGFVSQLDYKQLSRVLVAPQVDRLRSNESTDATWFWAKQLGAEKGRLDWFANLAIKTRSEGGRDVLAYAATKGRYGFPELSRMLESYRIESFKTRVSRTLGKDHWRLAFLYLARVLYSQNLSPMDRLDALTIYRLVEEHHGPDSIAGVNQTYYADLLTWIGDPGAAQEQLARPADTPRRQYAQEFLALNTINPSVTGTGDLQHWLDGLNALLVRHGLAPVSIESGDCPDFYHLTAEAPPCGMEHMPLVSVVMPVYEPDAATDRAIESLLAQSWSNIELIIVDDASPRMDSNGFPTDYRDRLLRWQGRDPRIRITFCEENRGAYAVRNDGYDMARGEFITVADKDDWHHPQKIELQVTELLANPDLPANLTNWVRVDGNLKFLIRWGPDRVIHPSFASLMYRTEWIRRDLGYWDQVRKSGDGEFKYRAQAVYGVDLQPTFAAPLAFSLMGTDNLTSADLGLGYAKDDRVAYERAFKEWHRQRMDESGTLYLEKNPVTRPFVAPVSFLPNGRGAETRFDVVFLSEFGFLAGNSSVLYQEIMTCVNAGLRVGVIPIMNGLIPSASKRHFSPKLEELVHSGKVQRLSLESEVQASLLLVRWPAAMQLRPAVAAKVQAERILVVSNHAPYERENDRRSYDLRVVSDNIWSTFGKRPVWAAESEQITKIISPLLPPEELLGSTWKGIVIPPPEEFRHFLDVRKRSDGTPPVIGRHGRDDVIKWPDSREEFLAAYPTDGSVRVAVLGGASVPQRLGFLPAALPDSWDVTPFNGMPVSDFLRGLDFFVYYHSAGLTEAFGMTIIEAMSHGVVCVLPPHFEAVFKDGAVYAEARDAMATVWSLWDPDAYRTQQQRGLDFVERECSSAAYLQRLQHLGVEVDGLVHRNA